MTGDKLKYLSEQTVRDLRSDILLNVERYRTGDFKDLMPDGDWSLELEAQVDLSPLEKLDPSGNPAAEIENSKLVWRAFGHLKPSLAYEEGIWVRLTHVECLEFSRARWLAGVENPDDIAKRVDDHFFADTVARRRDDNPISRLWWNAYIANMIEPDGKLRALDQFLKRADIRLNFVERSLTVYRPSIAAGIVRLMERSPVVTESDDNFRSFMRVINRLGGGMLFEAMSAKDIDAFMEDCASRAGLISGAAEYRAAE
tara:strand:- start:8473 stop:9243 length:771 start_codon:yes stop_codon:yes gene_type:complete